MNEKSKKEIQETEKLVNQTKKIIEDSYSKVLKDGNVRKAINDGNDNFSFDSNHSANEAANKVLGQMGNEINAVLLNGIKKTWVNSQLDLWNELEQSKVRTEQEQLTFNKIKETAMVSIRDKTAQSFYNQKRDDGLNISDRVWNLSGNAKKEIEIIVQNGIKKGQGAEQIQESLTKYFKYPEELFKPVKIDIIDAETGEKIGVKYELSKAAQKYKPGRGVYKSAYKNAMRLVRTEMKSASCEAIWNAGINNPLITGWKIELSNNHTTLVNDVPVHFKDMCDELEGIYPKTFKFKGWHPQCRCIMTPVIISDDDYRKLVAAEDAGEVWKPKDITQLPQQFNDWIEKNKGRIATASRIPNFITDNFKGGLLSNGLKELIYAKNNIQDLVQTKENITFETSSIKNTEATDKLKRAMETKTDRNDNPIGNGDYHVSYVIFDFPEYDFINTSVTFSNTSESVYVRYTNMNNGKSITVRFSTHISNAIEFGDQLNGATATKEEVLYHLGLMKRTFIPESYLSINKRNVGKSEMKNYKEAELTIKEMYALGENADLSRFVGKLAKGSNYLILGSKVEKVYKSGLDRLGRTAYFGKYIYEPL